MIESGLELADRSRRHRISPYSRFPDAGQTRFGSGATPTFSTLPPRWCSLEESLSIEWNDLCYETLDHTYSDLTEDNPGWDDFWIELHMHLEYLKKLTRDHFREW